jgi:hypothetical protein
MYAYMHHLPIFDRFTYRIERQGTTGGKGVTGLLDHDAKDY